MTGSFEYINIKFIFHCLMVIHQNLSKYLFFIFRFINNMFFIETNLWNKLNKLFVFKTIIVNVIQIICNSSSEKCIYLLIKNWITMIKKFPSFIYFCKNFFIWWKFTYFSTLWLNKFPLKHSLLQVYFPFSLDFFIFSLYLQYNFFSFEWFLFFFQTGLIFSSLEKLCYFVRGFFLMVNF